MKIITLVVLILFNSMSVYADIPGGTQPRSFSIVELILSIIFIVAATLTVLYLRDNK